MYINKSTYWAMVLAIVVGAVAGWYGSYCCQKINEHWQLVDTVSQNHIYVLQCVESRQRETIAAQRQRIAELERQLQEKGNVCFQSVDDYDWIASVYEVSDEVATERLRCCECGGRINVGEKCRSVYMQRYEECRLCCGDIREQWDHDYEGQKLPPCDNDQHDYGETVQDYVCERCCKMIETIEEVENAEGCTAPHNRPLHGELREAFWESDHAVEYIDRARDKFPELAACGYLDKVYKLTREYDDEIGDRWECRDIRKHDEIFDMIGGEG